MDFIKMSGRYQHNEKGQSLVELAIGLTLMVLLLSGIFDVGRAIFTQFALQDAAEEGLVYGIGYPDQCTLIKERVLENLDNNVLPINLTADDVLVTLAGTDCENVASLTYGMRMDVIVSSPFTISMPFLSGIPLTLTGSANGTILRPPPGT